MRIGGSILASLGSFQQLWMSKQAHRPPPAPAPPSPAHPPTRPPLWTVAGSERHWPRLSPLASRPRAAGATAGRVRHLAQMLMRAGSIPPSSPREPALANCWQM